MPVTWSEVVVGSNPIYVVFVILSISTPRGTGYQLSAISYQVLIADG